MYDRPTDHDSVDSILAISIYHCIIQLIFPSPFHFHRGMGYRLMVSADSKVLNTWVGEIVFVKQMDSVTRVLRNVLLHRHNVAMSRHLRDQMVACAA